MINEMQNDSLNEITWEDGAQIVQLFALRLSFTSSLETIQSLLPFVSEDKKERILKFRLQEDAHRTLFGDLLIRKTLIDQIHLTNNQIQFTENEFGKPHLKGHENIHFNIAHSGEWVFCALAKKPVGVDVEVIKPRNMDVAKRFFSEEELEHLFSKSESDQLSLFYKIWTLKESYIKMIGKGLHCPLNTFTIDINGGPPYIKLNGERNNSVYFKTFPIDPKYQMALCAKSFNCAVTFLSIQESELITHFLSGQTDVL